MRLEPRAPGLRVKHFITELRGTLMPFHDLFIYTGTCKVPEQVDSIIKECNAPYEIDLEEKGNYGPGWTDISTSNSTRFGLVCVPTYCR